MALARYLPGSLLAAVLLASGAPAQEDSPPSPPLHDGALLSTEGEQVQFQVEVVCHRDAIHVYLYDGEGKPLDPKGVKARLEVKLEGQKGKGSGTSLKYVAPPRSRDPEAPAAVGHLATRGRFQRVPEEEATVALHLEELPGSEEAVADLETPYRLPRIAEFVCPMKCVPPAGQPGKCARCGMALVEETFIYACPHHQHVTSLNEKEKCWVCQVRLERRAESGGGAHHGGGGGHQ